MQKHDDDIDQGGSAFWRSGLQRLGLHNSHVLLLLLRRLGSQQRRWHKDFDGTTSGTVREIEVAAAPLRDQQA